MPRRTARTSRKAASPRRKAASPRRKSASPRNAAGATNQKIQWSVYRDLQKQIDKAWAALQRHVQNNAPAQTLTRAKNDLLLLLGECNYMARECARVAQKSKQRFTQARRSRR